MTLFSRWSAIVCNGRGFILMTEEACCFDSTDDAEDNHVRAHFCLMRVDKTESKFVTFRMIKKLKIPCVIWRSKVHFYALIAGNCEW